MDKLILHAERFETHKEAHVRWQELEKRMAANNNIDGIVVSGVHNKQYLVLGMIFTDHQDFFAGGQNVITNSIEPEIWLALAKRHEERHTEGQRAHEVFRHGEDNPVRVPLPPKDKG